MNINAYLVIYIVTEDLEKTKRKPGITTIHTVAEPEGL